MEEERKKTLGSVQQTMRHFRIKSQLSIEIFLLRITTIKQLASYQIVHSRFLKIKRQCVALFHRLVLCIDFVIRTYIIDMYNMYIHTYMLDMFCIVPFHNERSKMFAIKITSFKQRNVHTYLCIYYMCVFSQSR